MKKMDDTLLSRRMGARFEELRWIQWITDARKNYTIPGTEVNFSAFPRASIQLASTLVRYWS